MPYQAATDRSNEDDRNSNTNADVRMLDLIAVCLTTGKAGDVVATALDKCGKLGLFLAKNGVPTEQDYRIMRRFFADLNAMDAKDWMVFPFLITHSRANMDKRIRTAITTFMPELESALNQALNIRPNLLKMGFPSRLLIESVCTGSGAAIQGNNLSTLSRVPRPSQLRIKPERDDFVVGHGQCAEVGATSGQGLPICQHCTTHIVCERLFPEGDVPFHWIQSVFDGTREGFA